MTVRREKTFFQIRFGYPKEEEQARRERVQKSRAHFSSNGHHPFPSFLWDGPLSSFLHPELVDFEHRSYRRWKSKDALLEVNHARSELAAPFLLRPSPPLPPRTPLPTSSSSLNCISPSPLSSKTDARIHLPSRGSLALTDDEYLLALSRSVLQLSSVASLGGGRRRESGEEREEAGRSILQYLIG